MTAPRIAMVAIALAFAAAEIDRPTRAVEPKRIVAHGLVLAAQVPSAETADTLNQELLNDLPRIHPNALGMLASRRHGAVTIVDGWIADPYVRAPGLAVFPIVAGRRIANARTIYGRARPLLAARFGEGVVSTGFQVELPSSEAPVGAPLAVGLIARDQRGYFLLGSEAADGSP